MVTFEKYLIFMDLGFKIINLCFFHETCAPATLKILRRPLAISSFY